MIPRLSLSNTLLAASLACGVLGAGTASAQPMLYAQRLPEGTVYIRLASALPAAATVSTDFAGSVSLGNTDATRISPYFVAEKAGGKTVALQVAEGSKTVTATIQPKSGAFITVVLEEKGSGVTAAIVTDKPEYNQLKARLSFYNATDDCGGGSLAQGSRAVFSGLAPDTGQALSLNPVSATVVASCGSDKAKPLDLGKLEAGGLYSVWMMRLGGQLISFMAHDTIAPPRS